MTAPITRTRGDLCPGVLRPWPAEDGALVRLRLVGGAVRLDQLVALSHVAREYGDGDVHITKRANLQVRGLPTMPDSVGDTALTPGVVQAIEATGLLPTRTHELVRNILLSPLTGVSGGLADLRPIAAALDEALQASAAAAGLSARFLFVLDDGRGDVIHRTSDLAVVALDQERAQVRVGPDGWTAPLAMADVVPTLLDHAVAFVAARGTGPDAPWHVHELTAPLVSEFAAAAQRTLEPSPPPPYGPVIGAPTAEHREVPGGLLTPAYVDALAVELRGRSPRIVVTPWRSLVLAQA